MGEEMEKQIVEGEGCWRVKISKAEDVSVGEAAGVEGAKLTGAVEVRWRAALRI